MVETQEDEYLDGRVRVVQPSSGYRAGVDTVMLAASVAAKPGERVLELGAGVGVAARCLLWRVPDLHVTCVEREADFASLARENLNGFSAEVVIADIANLPSPLKDQNFDHVMFNPPFFGQAQEQVHPLKSAAHVQDTPMDIWVDVARRRLKPKGHLSVIQRSENLADLIRALDGFGDVSILPIAARSGRPAARFLLRARKGSRAGSALLPSFVMHDGEVHLSDGDDYSAAAQSVLRSGAPICMSE